MNHLYRSALKVAVTQMEILDEEFASLYDHSPIHHIEYRIKTLESISDKLRRGYDVTIDNIYAYIQDVAGIRVICNYLDDIYYLRSLLTRSESFKVLRRWTTSSSPRESGYRSLHLIIDVPIVISEGTLHQPVEIQLRTIAMDMWASLEHELRYKSDRNFSDSDAARLRLCSEAISEIDLEMQDIYQARNPAMSKAKECCGCAALLCFGWFFCVPTVCFFPIAFPLCLWRPNFSQQLESGQEPFETDGFKTSFPLKSFCLL